YRGYPVTELAEKVTFDEVAYLLLHGDLPSAARLDEFRGRVAAARRLPDALRNLLRALPRSTNPMDVLRSSVSILAHFDPDTDDGPRAANRRRAERLLGQTPVAVAEQYRLCRGLQPVPPRPDLPHAANFLYMLRGAEAGPGDVHAFDVSLIL